MFTTLGKRVNPPTRIAPEYGLGRVLGEVPNPAAIMMQITDYNDDDNVN